MSGLIPVESIINKIVFLRSERVLLDRDIAELYGVETKQLKRAVRRNLNRFPSDFMFEVTRDEYNSLRSQVGTLKRGAHSKYLPMAFTEQGVAMLSSVLNSDRAIEVNISIMRAFVQLRKISLSPVDFAKKLSELEAQFDDHDEKIEAIFRVIQELIGPDQKPKKKRIGYTVKEKQATYGKKAKGKGGVGT